jgi:hypothetical protein
VEIWFASQHLDDQGLEFFFPSVDLGGTLVGGVVDECAVDVQGYLMLAMVLREGFPTWAGRSVITLSIASGYAEKKRP